MSKKAQSAAEENASLKGNLQNQAASKAHASHRRSNSRAEQQMAKLLAGDIDELALAPRKMSLSRESVSFVRLPDASPFLDDMNLFGNDLDDADTSRRQHPRRRPSLQLVRSPSTTIEHAKSAATSADEEASIVETVDDDDDYADDVESVIVQAPPSAPVRSRADERPSVEKRAPPGAVVAAAVDVVAAAPVPDDDVRHAGSIQQAAAVEPVDDVSAAGSGGPYRVSAEKQEASKLQVGRARCAPAYANRPVRRRWTRTMTTSSWPARSPPSWRAPTTLTTRRTRCWRAAWPIVRAPCRTSATSGKLWSAVARVDVRSGPTHRRT